MTITVGRVRAFIDSISARYNGNPNIRDWVQKNVPEIWDASWERFIPADVDKWDLMMLHFQAWEKGIKSLYYLRSKSVQRAGFAGGVEADNTADLPKYELASQTDYEECLACQ